MNKIHKIALPLIGANAVDLPRQYEVLHVDAQNGEVKMWILANFDSEEWVYNAIFYMFNSNIQIPDRLYVDNYRGSCILPNNIEFHVFEEPNNKRK